MSLLPNPVPYHEAPAATADPRLIEAWALSETALRMTVARQAPVDETALLHAVRLNWRLWTIFQASLFDPECPLPIEVRNNILSLAAFVDKHTAGIVADPDPGKLDILISINENLAAGLSVVPTPTAEPAER
jgi:flagellar protein FlaF